MARSIQRGRTARGKSRSLAGPSHSGMVECASAFRMTGSALQQEHPEGDRREVEVGDALARAAICHRGTAECDRAAAKRHPGLRVCGVRSRKRRSGRATARLGNAVGRSEPPDPGPLTCALLPLAPESQAFGQERHNCGTNASKCLTHEAKGRAAASWIDRLEANRACNELEWRPSILLLGRRPSFRWVASLCAAMRDAALGRGSDLEAAGHAE